MPYQPVLIGSDGWDIKLLEVTSTLDIQFWSRFVPIHTDELDRLENLLRRKLPDDFRCFLNRFGAGNFPDEFGGGIFSPREIVEGCIGPIQMLRGSDGWADSEGQRQFYVSRGQINPNSAKFVDGIARHCGINLFDLVRIGYDGMSCYYQLFCPKPRSDLGFCRITPEGTIEDQLGSFSEGLALILRRFHEQQNS